MLSDCCRSRITRRSEAREKPLNWDAIAAVGEILGAVAVLVTVAYLAVQVRQNTASVGTATHESALSGFNEINLAIAQSEELASIFQRGLYDPESLSEVDGVRFAFIMRALSNQYFKVLRLHDSGALSMADWGPYAREAGQIYRTPGGQIFRSEHANYADLFSAMDQFAPVKTTAFRFGEGGSPSEPSSDGAIVTSSMKRNSS